MLSRSRAHTRAVALAPDSRGSGAGAHHRLRVGMEEHVLDYRADGQLADLLIAMPPIELQITGIAGIQHHTLRTAVLRAPVVKCLEQLLATMLPLEDRKSTRLNSSHVKISYAYFCLKKKNIRYCNMLDQ